MRGKLYMAKSKQKCKYCNLEYEEYTDLKEMFRYNLFECCEKCKEIQKLYTFLKKIWDQNAKKKTFNPVFRENMLIKEGQQLTRKTRYKVIGRSKKMCEIINNIKYIRDFLFFNVAGQFEILESIYEKKDIFWEESGNLLRYVHDATFEYIVIKLKELISNEKSKYSIIKIRNILINNKRSFFVQQRIYEIFEYENGASFEIEYDAFPIVDYFAEIDSTLKTYSNMIEALSDFRDNKFAHIAEIKNINSAQYLNYLNLKRIYNLLIVIYDGLLLSIAPDQFSKIFVYHDIRFAHLDQIVEEHRKNHH